MHTGNPHIPYSLHTAISPSSVHTACLGHKDPQVAGSGPAKTASSEPLPGVPPVFTASFLITGPLCALQELLLELFFGENTKLAYN